MNIIQFKQLHEKAKLPTFGSKVAAGMDLYAIEPCTILPSSQVKIPTGLSVAIPYGYYGRVAPRSGLAVNHGVNVHAGVIDADYRGEIHVCLINHGHMRVEFKPGDRIAQLIIERCLMLDPIFVEELGSTERGTGGFGSTGA